MAHRIHVGCILVFALSVASLLHSKEETPTQAEVKAIGNRVADWMVTHHLDSNKFKAGGGARRKSSDLGWIRGAMYTGMWEFSAATDQRKYADYLKGIGGKHEYKLEGRTNKYHADGHTVGQAWLNLYRRDKDQAMLTPTRSRFDWILANRKKGSLRWGRGTDCHSRYGWCDALFMAPPVWARLARITGEKKYLDFMHEEYRASYDLLWDREENLFWRDSSFFKRREKNGRKMFWARGNGWVFGGLALMIPDLPKDWEGRAFYVDTYKKMAAKLIKLQRPDGTWSMGLLGDVKDYPTIETSGTGFFVFGLAWGINQGILDRKSYQPAVLKGWHALTNCVDKDGLLGYVQPVGAAPGRSYPGKTEDYGIGAFLGAAAEVYKLVGKSGSCFARFVPERLDDFAWENDRIAFRMYGPALWKNPKQRCGNGIDVWTKKVRYPIINKWYKSKNYHRDTGEGGDFYKVGKTLGCGGTGLWVDRNLHIGGHFTGYKVITGKGDKIEFELTYAPITAGEVSITEVKRISMEAGTNFFKVRSTFTLEGADDAVVAIGMALHGNKGQIWQGSNWCTYAYPDNKKNGRIYTAIIMPFQNTIGIADDHALYFVSITNKQTVTYYVGAAWSKGLDFKSYDEWKTYVQKEADIGVIRLMNNSGWCWYQDPRAIIHKDKLFIGGVEGNRNGNAVVGVYDLKERTIPERTVVHEKYDRDDHNSPVFYARPDGRLLAMYARHSRDRFHHYRVSDAQDVTKWGEEKAFRHDYPKAGNVTYMNLYYLAEEKRLYNFFRGIEFNPCLMTSDDHGDTWNKPVHFIKSEIKGRHRPYARYCSDGKGTVHVSFTDGHPRQFGNSIYYAAFRGGRFYRADGTLIKSLKEKGPLRPSEADKAFQGGGGPGRGGSQSALKSGWTSAIALDKDGHPHIGYSLYLSNTDHRYRIASWDGKKWVDREVAYGGKCLYDRESSYTGLITFDPADPTKVVISTDVAPSTGKDLNTHEIFEATVGAADDVKSITWRPLTEGTSKGTRNIRPMILNNDDYRIILWQRGRFKTFTDYDLDTVGIVQRKK